MELAGGFVTRGNVALSLITRNWLSSDDTLLTKLPRHSLPACMVHRRTFPMHLPLGLLATYDENFPTKTCMASGLRAKWCW